MSHEASLEILADGSELTEPAIFLTIRRRVTGRRIARPAHRDVRPGAFFYETVARNNNSEPPFSGENADAAKEEEGGGTIVARYNLTGLPSLTGRLSSDQSFKLLQGGAFRSVLIPSSSLMVGYCGSVGDNGNGNGAPAAGVGVEGAGDCASLGGLPALFLSLIQSGYQIARPSVQSKISSKKRGGDARRDDDDDAAGSDSAPEDDDDDDDVKRRIPKNENTISRSGGYGDVSIVGPPGTGARVDGILDTMFGNYGRRRPSIRICEVPGGCNWWEVYGDSYVRMWAQSVAVCSGGGGGGNNSSSSSEDGSLCGDCADAEKNDGSDDDDDDDEDDDASSSESSSSDDESDSDSDDASGNDKVSNRKGSGSGSGISTSSSPPAVSDYSIVFIVMLLPQNDKEGNGRGKSKAKDRYQCQQPYSFAIIPAASSSPRTQSRKHKKCHACGTSDYNRQPNRNYAAPFLNALRNLPQEVISTKREGGSSVLDFILHLDPLVDDRGHTSVGENCSDNGKVEGDESFRKRRRIEETQEEVAESIRKKVPHNNIVLPSWVIDSKIAKHHLATFPNSHFCKPNGNNDDACDPGILIRAQHRSRLFHSALPFSFPLSSNNPNSEEIASPPMKGNGSRNVKTPSSGSVVAFGLSSCTSVILAGVNKRLGKHDGNKTDGIGHENLAEPPFVFVSRIEGISVRCKDKSFSSWAEMNCADATVSPTHDDVDFVRTVQSLKCAFGGGTCFCNDCKYLPSNEIPGCSEDENEINLSDGDNNEISLSDCESNDSQSEENYNNTTGATECPGKGSTLMNESSCNESADVASPHILILGTGCATPSPLRGASSFGVLLPALMNGIATLVLSAIIECGEGTLTGLLRHLPHGYNDADSINSHLTHLDVQLSNVAFIWISHSHLDHYGDLPIVVQAIAKAKGKLGRCTQQQSNPLVVIAPSKVIKYLNVLLRQPNTSRTKGIGTSQGQLYVSVTHREFQHSPFAGHLRSFVYDYALVTPTNVDVKQDTNIGSKTKSYYRPFASLRNVEVEHCREAFALILQMKIPTKCKRMSGILNTNLSDFVLCFSGDTRPSDRLVNECRTFSSPQPHMQTWQQKHHPQRNMSALPKPSVSLLIHEATFLNDSHGKIDAVKKRHSTTAEALDVAQRMNAEACLLTHFSQRYKRVSINDISSIQKNSYPFSWGIALDGMMIPLTKRAIARLFQLSLCIDALTSTGSDEGQP